MLPPDNPQAELVKDSSPVKTPRPDVSIGISVDTVINRLQMQGLDGEEALNLLESLQWQMTKRDPRKQPEPVLCSRPTRQELRLRFPFLIVEAKSYATGTTFFEAENQVAVSGACALKIQRDLDAIAEVASPRSGLGSSAGNSHLVFSICTQGPFHELWAHYDSFNQNGVQKFHMVMVASCCAQIQREVVQWLMAVDNVMTWGSENFLNSVVERLGRLAV